VCDVGLEAGFAAVALEHPALDWRARWRPPVEMHRVRAKVAEFALCVRCRVAARVRTDRAQSTDMPVAPAELASSASATHSEPSGAIIAGEMADGFPRVIGTPGCAGKFDASPGK
jgi:hypothetical protein